MGNAERCRTCEQGEAFQQVMNGSLILCRTGVIFKNCRPVPGPGVASIRKSACRMFIVGVVRNSVRLPPHR